jgi:hypothetical protein
MIGNPRKQREGHSILSNPDGFEEKAYTLAEDFARFDVGNGLTEEKTCVSLGSRCRVPDEPGENHRMAMCSRNPVGGTVWRQRQTEFPSLGHMHDWYRLPLDVKQMLNHLRPDFN